jgi:hypothetical protein
VQAAGSPTEYAKGIAGVGTPAAAAAGDAAALRSSIKTYVSSAQTLIKNAFGGAPSCQALSKST